MRELFKEEQKRLKDGVLQVFDDVISQFEKILSLIEDFDREKASEVMKYDDLIDAKVQEIEECGIQLIATQCPVASDLRFIHSVLIINIHLERIGDLIYNTARALIRLNQIRPLEVEQVKSLLKMGNTTLSIIKKAKEAFESMDVQMVEELPELDEKVDEMFKEFLKGAGKLPADEQNLEWYFSFALISRYFERAADQAVDIGERVLYMITGKISEID